ncbi:MAG TPA: ATP-binding protein [Steroidobacteraceae bacterium]|nr:ATP-binding protein [Steroidobacteraceae bacterium]
MNRELKSLSSDLVRSVLESAPDAMIIFDAAGSVLFANRQVSALFGYKRAELVGQKVELLLPERFRGRHVEHRSGFGQSVRMRPMGAGLDLFARRRDGSEFPVEISLSPIEQGGNVMVAAAIRDVTDRARIESDMRIARTAADQANQSKGRFLATASHDLRQPLQTLSLLSGTLRRLVDDPQVREVLDEQDLALGTMSRLLNALLDISKLESGVVKPEIVHFDVADLLEELRLESAGVAASKGLVLCVESTNARACSDPTLVAQALKNLVSNAIKYTSRGHVQLRAISDGKRVKIEVSDTGRGIAAEHLPQIFEEFYQVGVGTNASRDGYGLGLSIVQRVAKLLKLGIEVQSNPGEGSTFTLELPAGKPAFTTAPRHVRARGTLPPRAGAARHLLLVEDDPGVRNATRMFLKGEGFRVSEAASLEEALQRLEENPDIQVIVSDYHLEGGRTGVEVIAAARQRVDPGIPAILVTGETAPLFGSLREQPHLLVASKPVEPDTLLQLIQSLVPG